MAERRFSRNDAAALQAALDERIRAAQADRAEFFSFVMVDPEKPGQRMRCTPHQRVAFDFYDYHSRGVVRWPTDTGKTLFTVGAGLYDLGNDPSLTMLLVGKSEEIAQKPFGILRNYVELPDLAARARMVFPKLAPSTEPGQAWTATEITIDRPAGQVDPSARAVGLDSDFQGKKVRRYLADDLLDPENTGTEYQRKKLKRNFFSLVNSRLVPGDDSKGFLINVPWDKRDLTFSLEEDGWATLHMDVYGNVCVSNTDWESPLLRPSRYRKPRRDGERWYRLVAHDPDPGEQTPLMPIRWSLPQIAKAKRDEPPSEFSRSRKCEPVASEEARCQRIWIEGGEDEDGNVFPGCLRRGRTTVRKIDRGRFGKLPIYIGMDLSTGEGEDESALAAIGIRENAKRVLLNVEGDKWEGPEQATRGLEWTDAYDADLVVESNGYQKTLRQWMVALRPEMKHRIHALHTDDKKKDSLLFGIEAIFGEFYRGEWEIPADEDGRLEPEVEALVQDCLDYRPGQHVGDRLMALWIARARAHGRILALMQAQHAAAPRTPEEDILALGRLNTEQWRGRGKSSSGTTLRRRGATGGF